MTHSRHLRQRFRHARRTDWRRVSTLPVVSAATLGVVGFATLPAAQSLTTAMAAGRAEQPASAVDLSAVPAHAALDVAAQADGKQADGKPADGKPADTKPAGTRPAEPKQETKPAEPKAGTKPAEAKRAEPAAPAELELHYLYGVQTTPWYCGPAATRMALSARGIYPSQDYLAGRLGTTVNGTNSSVDIARVLNALTHTSQYQATSIPAKAVSKQQADKLRTDVVDAIRHGYPVVMNIIGSGTDTAGTIRSFPGGHYITVVGYRANGNQVKIGDSADPTSPSYWMDTSELAEWAGSRGYAA